MSDPDAPPLFVEDLIRTLDDHAVSYVVVGGVAAAMHGSARGTLDLDITPLWTSPNLDRLADALTSMGAKLRAEGPEPAPRELVDYPISGTALANFEVSTWRTRYGDLDVVVGTPTTAGPLSGYRDLTVGAAQVTAYGITILAAGLDDLIEAKRALRRTPDLSALPELYRLRDVT